MIYSPPTKLVASANGIPIFQPEKLSKSPETFEAMRLLKPDVLVMVAFGQILKKPVLEMAPHGVVNVHASLLPKYRGPAPINWAIINGETETGVTTMFSDPGVDTGSMLLKEKVAIGPDTNAEELGQALAETGANLLVRTLEQLSIGAIKPEEQDDAQASYAPLLKRDMGVLDWSKPARDIHNLVRGLYSWPGTQTGFEGGQLKITRTGPVDQVGLTSARPGEVIALSNHLLIACGPDGGEAIELVEVQPANRARMSARDWANGVRLKLGAQLG